MRFVDTNVLLYSISREPDEAEKRAEAEAILDSSDLALSAQVSKSFMSKRSARVGKRH